MEVHHISSSLSIPSTANWDATQNGNASYAIREAIIGGCISNPYPLQ